MKLYALVWTILLRKQDIIEFQLTQQNSTHAQILKHVFKVMNLNLKENVQLAILAPCALIVSLAIGNLVLMNAADVPRLVLTSFIFLY